jgi:hypothetical protein
MGVGPTTTQTFWRRIPRALSFSGAGDSTNAAKGISLRADRWRQSPALARATAAGALVSLPPSHRQGSSLFRFAQHLVERNARRRPSHGAFRRRRSSSPSRPWSQLRSLLWRPRWRRFVLAVVGQRRRLCVGLRRPRRQLSRLIVARRGGPPSGPSPRFRL